MEKRQERLDKLYSRMEKVQQDLFKLNDWLEVNEKEYQAAQKTKKAAEEEFSTKQGAANAELKRLHDKQAYYTRSLAELKRLNADEQVQCFIHCVPSNADLSRYYKYNEARTLTGNYLPCGHSFDEHRYLQGCVSRFVCQKHHRSWYKYSFDRYSGLKREYYRLSGMQRKLEQGKDYIELMIADKMRKLNNIEFNNEFMKHFTEVKEKNIQLKERIKNKEQELAGIQSMLQIYENGKAAGSENEAVRQELKN